MRNKMILGLVLFVAVLMILPTDMFDGAFYSDEQSIMDPLQIEENVKIPAADGDNWLDGWRYRQKLPINVVFGAPAGYSMKVEVYYNVGTDDDGVVNCTNKLSFTDFRDVRFTDNDGSTVLSYWRETYTASTTATFWVKVNDAVSSGTVVIYIYYGNTDASYIGDGEDTFLFFDDFENNNFDRWDTAQAAWSISSAVKKYGSYAAKGNAQTTDRMAIVNLTESMTTGVLFHSWVYFESNAGTEFPLIGYEGDAHGNSLCYVGYTPVNDWATYDGANKYYEENTQGASTWYRFEVAVDFVNTLLRPWINRVAKSSQTLESSTNGAIESIYRIAMFVASSTSAYDHWQDDFYVRHYYYSSVHGEPKIDKPNAEEDGAVVTNGAVSCTNLDDTDNLYARYKTYNFSVAVAIPAGGTKIQYVYLGMWYSSSLVWNIIYTESTNAFAESDGLTYVDGTTGQYSKTSTGITVYFNVIIEWAHPNYADCDLRVWSRSDWLEEDTDWYNETANGGNLDVETRLDIDSYSLSDGSGTTDRGNYNSIGSITAQAHCVYYGGTVSPLSAEVDFWVVCANVTLGNWEDDTISAGLFEVAVDSDDVVIANSRSEYTFKVVIEGAGPGGTDQCVLPRTAYYIADRVQVTGYGVSDTRDNINDNVQVNVYLIYDWDNTYVTDGTVTINGLAATHVGSGVWRAVDNKAIAQLVTYDTAAASGNTHGVTLVDQNGQDQDVIWDSYTVTFTVGDNRININTNATVGYTVVSDYDAIAYDGTVNLNYSTWTQATVQRQGFTVSSLGGDDTYGITAISTNDEDYVIWDYVKTYLTMPTDSRINTGANASGMEVHGLYAYDDAAFDGTITLNDTTYNYGVVGIYYYTVQSLTGDTYGITVFSKIQGGGFVQNAWCIFDQVIVKWINTNDTYCELNGYALLTVGLMYEYDSVDITAGTFSLKYGTTYLTLTHLISGNWTTTDTSAVATSRTYNAVNGTATLYGITVVNMDGKTVTVHWDVILLTVTINLTWTIVGYNVSIGVSGVYDFLGYVWNGTATLNGTWTIPCYPFQTVVGNYSYIVTSITNDDLTLVGFTANTVWCIWDDLAFSYGTDWYKANSYTSYFYWGGLVMPIQFTWAFNSSPVADSPMVLIQGYTNGTADDYGVISTGTLGVGYFGGLLFGPFDDTWYYADLQINAQFGGYNWSIWSSVEPVDVLHSIHFPVYTIDNDGNYLVITYYTELGFDTNVTVLTIWDTTLNASTDYMAAIFYNDTRQGVFYIPMSDVVGVHNLFILINQTTGVTYTEQELNTTLTDDWWSWNVYSYRVRLVVDLIPPAIEDAYVLVSGTINADANWYAYEGVTLIDNGTIAPDAFSFAFARNTTVGLHRFWIWFNVSATEYVNKTGSYYVSATYDWAYVNPYLPSGEGLDLIKFRLYVNESRIYDRDWRFYNRTDCVYNITITDFFGAIVHQNNHSWARGIDILLNLYTFKVCHMIDDTYIYFTLTSSGGSSYSEYIMPKEIVIYYLYTANTYTYSYSASLNGTDSATYTGTMTVSGDVALIIVSYGVEKILQELGEIEHYAMNSGGGNSAAIAVMSVELWWLRLTIFGGVGILAFLVIGTAYMRRNVTYASYTTSLERKGKPRGKPFTSRYNPKKGKSDIDRLADDMWGS